MTPRKKFFVSLVFITLAAWFFASCGGGPGKRERIVFVTPDDVLGLTTGNLGGLSGADDSCQNWADTYGLEGTYKAWLSDISHSPDDRFTKDGSFKLVDGTVVANDWADLTDGTLQAAIDMEPGGTYVYWAAWTFTCIDGTSRADLASMCYTGVDGHCANWTFDGSAQSGGIGDTSRADAYWTLSAPSSLCDVERVLYCFQQ